MRFGEPPRKPSQTGLLASNRELGAYILDERLASGGTADVFLAHPAVGDHPAPQVVIKRLLTALRSDPASRAAFAREAALQRRFKHPNIVECYEAGVIDGEPFLVMELVLGADLDRVLRLSHARKRPIAPPIACFIAGELLSALSVVHAATDELGAPLGIVHRDVSPSNVYLSTTGLVKLGDFGIAHPTTPRTPRAGSLGGAIKGKFAYLAPEQVASEPADHRADLFSIANVLSEMMLGRPLFPGAGQLAVLLAIRDCRIEALEGPSAIPLALVQVLKRALAREPASRFPDAGSFADALRPFMLVDADRARREIAQLVRWARETSLELRAVGEHPDQREAAIVPIAAPQPALRLDSSILREEPSAPLPAVTILEAEPTSGPKPSAASPSENVTAEFSPLPSRVRTTDGRLVGPLTYAKLIELVVTGRLDPDDEVDFMGLGFERLEEIEELARHLAPRSTVTKQIAGPGAPDWHGFAAERYDSELGPAFDPGIATALSFVAAGSGSGVLIAQQGARRKEIYFESGRVHHVGSTEPGEMLGEYLVTQGLLDRGDLDFALAVLPRFNGHLGEALHGLGILDPMALFKAIQAQGRDKILEVFGWREGELSFYRDARAGKVDFPLDLPIGPIVEAGVAATFDEARGVARYRPWLGLRVRPTERAQQLLGAGFSRRVERVIALAREGPFVRDILDGLMAEWASEHEARCAIECARITRMVEWTV